MKPSGSRALAVAALAAIAALFLYLNFITPFYADDYSYMFTYAAGAPKERITSLYGLYLSQLNHYRVINGRAVVHTLVQLFLMGGRGVFNFANTAVFLLLGLAVCAAAWGRREMLRPWRVIAPFALIWLTLPGFGQSCLWLTGSVNYLWTACAAACFLLPYARGMEAKRPALAAAGIFALGALAGWSGENACLGAAAGLVCFLIRRYAILREPFAPWTLTGAAGFLAGAAALFLAPAQGVRISGTGGLAGFGEMLRRIPTVTENAVRYLWLPLLIGLACLVASIALSRGKGFMYWLRRWSDSLCWIAAALAAVYCMCAAPYFPLRAWCAGAVFGITAALSACAKLGRGLRPQMLVSAALAIACLACYGAAVDDILATRADVEARGESIEAQLAAGQEDVYAPSVYGRTRWNCFDGEGDLVDDPDSWQNEALALYYGAGHVIKAGD